MRKSIFFLLIVIMFLGAGQTQAFDGDRRGFVLDFGLGIGQGKLKASTSGVSSSVDATGGAAVLRLGGGINEHTVITYSVRAVAYKPTLSYTDPYYGGTTTVKGDLSNGFSGAELTYFLEPAGPSFFFTGGLGIGVSIDNDTDESESGLGISLGAGYEFSTNWVVEANFFTAKVSEEMGIDLSASGAMLTVSWFGY